MPKRHFMPHARYSQAGVSDNIRKASDVTGCWPSASKAALSESIVSTLAKKIASSVRMPAIILVMRVELEL